MSVDDDLDKDCVPDEKKLSSEDSPISDIFVLIHPDAGTDSLKQSITRNLEFMRIKEI